MQYSKYLISLIAIVIVVLGCNPDSDQFYTAESEGIEYTNTLTKLLSEHDGGQSSFVLPDPSDYDNIPQDPRNKLTREKVELGKLLFHETALATNSNFEESMHTFSCASCHHAQAGFQANLPQGIGDGGMGFGTHGEGRTFNPMCPPELIDVQPVRSPSALNIAYQTNVLWNGQFGATHMNEGTSDAWVYGTPIEANFLGYQGTETQAIAGLDVHRFGLSITKEFILNTVYKELFQIAFPNESEDFVFSKESAGLALAAYERTLLATESNWQRWLKGDKQALSEKELKGAISFFEKGCGSCHNGPALNSMEFHALGMSDLQNGSEVINIPAVNSSSLGRGGFTKNEADNYKFKVPQLYNLKDSKFYGHGSSFTTVRDVVAYKNEGIPQNLDVPHSQLANEFKPLNMTQEEISNIAYFIEESLYDPYLERYVPSALPSGLCFPNNDALSKVDLGCL